MDVYPNDKCARLLRWFGGIDGYKKGGRDVVTVEMTGQENTAAVTISHVVALCL